MFCYDSLCLRCFLFFGYSGFRLRIRYSGLRFSLSYREGVEIYVFLVLARGFVWVIVIDFSVVLL